MKEITAIIRMNKVQKTIDALSECGYPSFTVDKVMGRGKQKGSAMSSSHHFQNNRVSLQRTAYLSSLSAC
jgi:nitrogen regulatory protein PII